MLKYNKKNLTVIFTLILTGAVLVALFCLGPRVLAQSEDVMMTNAADLNLPGIGLRVGLVQTIVRIINIFLGLLGLIAISLLIYAGYIWMTAQGSEEKVSKAKKIIVNAVIGLVVILFSFIIVRVVITTVNNWANNQTIDGGDGGGGGGGGDGGGSLPPIDPGISDPTKFQANDVQTSHSGEENQENVRLCSTVQTIFNNSVKNESFNAEKTGNLKIVSVAGGTEQVFSETSNWNYAGRILQYKVGSKLFSANTTYRLYLPKTLKDTVDNSLSGCLPGGCADKGDSFVWQFKTGTEKDTTAPTITNFYPIKNSVGADLAPVVKIYFSEEIDGLSANANNIKIFDGEGRQVTKLTNFFISDRSITFGFQDLLKEFTKYTVKVAGILDLCGNLMSPANFEWTFETGNSVATVTSYRPIGDKVCPNAKIIFSFSSSMELNRIMLTLKTGEETKKIILPAGVSGNKSVEIAGVGKLTAMDNFYTNYEFIPASSLKVGSEYGAEVATDRKINTKGDFLKTNWKFKVESEDKCIADDPTKILSVVNDSRCQVSGTSVTVYPSPNPGRDKSNICPKAVISARFNKILDEATVNNNLKLFECTSENINSCAKEVGGVASVFAYDTNSSGVKLIPTNILITNKNYLAVIKAGIKAQDGTGLTGDYSWQFKTAATADCAPEFVDVLPHEFSATLPAQTIAYSAAAFGSGCQEMSGLTGWSWNSSDLSVAKVTANKTNSSLAAAVTDLAKKAGKTNISATVNNKTDFGILNYNPDPDAVTQIITIKSRNPAAGATSVCPNAVVQIVFDRAMNGSSLNSTNLKLSASSATDSGGCQAEAANFWCPVAVKINSYNSKDDKETIAEIVPETLLSSETKYRVEVVGGQNGVKGINGGFLASGENWQFTTQKGLCQINSVKIEPNRHLFNQAGSKRIFVARAFGKNKAGAENEIQSLTGYPFNWSWKKVDETNIISAVSGANSEIEITAQNVNGVATIYATAASASSVPAVLQSKATGSATISNFLCVNPVKIEGTTAESHYLTMYCRDKEGILLPKAKENNTTAADLGTALAEKFVLPIDDKNQATGDAVGIRVYANEKKLSASDWYLANVPNALSGATKTTVAGYDGIRVGRTVYVAGANVNNNKVYNNIYLMSYNDTAQAATVDIFGQLLKNWQFNENLDVVERGQLTRDSRRLADLATWKIALDNYYNQKGFYPKLLAGSYKIGESVSVWPSWGAGLVTEVGSAPVDPLNTLKMPCVAGADNAKYDQTSCWNDTDKVFACPINSHVYWYKSNGTTFSIYANMEYEAWSRNDSCEDYLITN